jgi:hypothetical protein
VICAGYLIRRLIWFAQKVGKIILLMEYGGCGK